MLGSKLTLSVAGQHKLVTVTATFRSAGEQAWGSTNFLDAYELLQCFVHAVANTCATAMAAWLFLLGQQD